MPYLPQPFRPTLMRGVFFNLEKGGFPERSKGSDCKSDGTAFTGSNPVPPIAQGCFNLEKKNEKVRATDWLVY